MEAGRKETNPNLNGREVKQMNKKRLLLLSGGVLAALLLVGLIGVAVVSAQDPTPESTAPSARLGAGPTDRPEAGPSGWHAGGRGRGGLGPGLLGRGMFGRGGGNRWTMFDTAAEALGLTPEELFTELHSGKSLEEIAEAQGVEMEVVQDTLHAAQVEARRQAIEQAVKDGKMSQAQADWLLEGLEQGFFPGGRGLGFGGRWGNPRPPESE